MALLQVRNFPDEMYETIAVMAKNERRSIAQQTVLIIERGLDISGDDMLDLRQSAIERTLAREPFANAEGVDFAAMIREDRSR